MQHRSSQGIVAEPNVIPMIDILLVLLIVFLLFSMAVGQLDIQLPQPATTPSTDVPLVLTVAPGPTYALNGTPLDRARLTEDLARIYDGRPDKVIFVDGDRRVSYQDVIAAFDAARGAGVTVSGITIPKRAP